jgi:Protein of unknown function (DUF3987)
MRAKNTPRRVREEVPVTAFDHSWADPDESLLEDRRGELPEFPVEVFPPHLSNWLLRASRGAGVRSDHIAVPLLGVTSSLIGMARRVQATSAWLEPMTLWTCVVAQSGERKTPGLKVCYVRSIASRRRDLSNIRRRIVPTRCGCRWRRKR